MVFSTAIKSSSGYIINGDWSILPDGRYMGAGTGFIYSRSNYGDIIQSTGPINVPIHIMVSQIFKFSLFTLI